MKHFIKMLLISAVLIGSVFLLNSNNTTNAANGTGKLNLQINSATGYCIYGSGGSLDFGNTGFGYASRTLQTGFMTSSGDYKWFCDDSEGDSGWNVSMQTTDLFNSASSNIRISSGLVYVINGTGYVMSGSANCLRNSGASKGTSVPLSGPVLLFGKYNSLGETCRIGSSGLDMKVYITGGQAPGIYSGTLTITLPDFNGQPTP